MTEPVNGKTTYILTVTLATESGVSLASALDVMIAGGNGSASKLPLLRLVTVNSRLYYHSVLPDYSF